MKSRDYRCHCYCRVRWSHHLHQYEWLLGDRVVSGHGGHYKWLSNWLNCCWCFSQRVVTYNYVLPIHCRSVCDCMGPDQESWLVKKVIVDCLIICSLPKLLIAWFYKDKNVATPPRYLRKLVDWLILVPQSLPWSLDQLLWLLDSISILVTKLMLLQVTCKLLPLGS